VLVEISTSKECEAERGMEVTPRDGSCEREEWRNRFVAVPLVPGKKEAKEREKKEQW
jgi:hypothetical protein